MKDQLQYSLLPHNTFGIDARCDRFVEYTTVDEAQQVAAIIRQSDAPLLIIGSGSNLLLTADYQGLVVHSAVMGHQVVSETDDQVLLRVGSGELWDDVVSLCVDHGWRGAENLSLIPGEVGASAVQNIGAYGAEVCQIIHSVEAVHIATGQTLTIAAADCQYGYRQSRFKGEWKNQYLITHVTYQLSKRADALNITYGNIAAQLAERHIQEPTLQQLRQVIIDTRQAKLPDPAVMGNAGSFFMNPVVSRDVYEQLADRYPAMPHYQVDDDHVKIPAGWLIDQCGWKGRSMGAAGVHDKQALVLVNRGGATGAQVVALCRAIQADVLQQFGIQIFPEVNII